MAAPSATGQVYYPVPPPPLPPRVTLKLERRRNGRRTTASARCRAPSATNRGRSRCTYFTAVKGQRTISARTGSNRVTLTRTFAGRTLRPGSYRLSLRPAAGSVRRLTFTVR